MARTAEILRLPGARLAPAVLLHQLLAREDLKGVVVVVMAEDDTFEAFWSGIRLADLCMAARTLDIRVTQEIQGTTPEVP